MRVLITGASSGIGAELARAYALEDCELILLARREDKLQSLKKELQQSVKSITILVVDVRNFKHLQESISSIGSVDTVILNAGVSIGHSKEITPHEDFNKLFEINVLANHAILEILLPHFKANQSGKIVFISSLASLFAMPTSLAYSASKRAINSYAEGLRYQYKNENIKVINILPGFITSELTDKNRFYMPFKLSTKDGVSRIKKAIDNERRFYAFPLKFYIIIRVINLLPQWLKDRFL